MNEKIFDQNAIKEKLVGDCMSLFRDSSYNLAHAVLRETDAWLKRYSYFNFNAAMANFKKDSE